MNQEEEIKTIRERNISLNLSDADVKRICVKAASVGLTVPELLQNFIGDLVAGTYNNGSDERDFAERWFNRCWFAMFPNDTFLQYLIDLDMVEVVVDDWSDEETKECAQEVFTEFVEQRWGNQEPLSIEGEMATVLKWWNEYQQLI